MCEDYDVIKILKEAEFSRVETAIEFMVQVGFELGVMSLRLE